MKKVLLLIGIFSVSLLKAQDKTAADFGFRHLVFSFRNEKVNVLIKSKSGEENKVKPMFFFCQGSLPKPLLCYEEAGAYGVFPFSPDSLMEKYHLVIAGKPAVPLIAHVATLQKDFTYSDSSGNFPQDYLKNNVLEYYVDRNLSLIRFLRRQNYFSGKELVLAGHSEGSTIAAHMAAKSRMVTHLIYSGGNPLGRILSIIQQSRSAESYTDSTDYAGRDFRYWEELHRDKQKSKDPLHQNMLGFSSPALPLLLKLKIPVLISYGTLDWSSPYNDFLRVEAIRRGKSNIRFHDYIATEHNYFPVNTNGTPDYAVFNWNKVAADWLSWLKENS